jgi:hypothetical protein
MVIQLIRATAESVSEEKIHLNLTDPQRLWDEVIDCGALLDGGEDLVASPSDDPRIRRGIDELSLLIQEKYLIIDYGGDDEEAGLAYMLGINVYPHGDI